MLPSFPRAPFLSFLKADYCLPIQAFWKAKEKKVRGWNVTSCNFRLLVKNNLNGRVVVFLSNMCWTHANRKLSQQQSYSEELRKYCCKSLFLQWDKLFAKDICITNVHSKSILESYKCQIFRSFTPNPQVPKPPAPKLRNSQTVSNDPFENFWLTSWQFQNSLICYILIHQKNVNEIFKNVRATEHLTLTFHKLFVGWKKLLQELGEQMARGHSKSIFARNFWPLCLPLFLLHAFF